MKWLDRNGKEINHGDRVVSRWDRTSAGRAVWFSDSDGRVTVETATGSFYAYPDDLERTS